VAAGPGGFAVLREGGLGLWLQRFDDLDDDVVQAIRIDADGPGPIQTLAGASRAPFPVR